MHKYLFGVSLFLNICSIIFLLSFCQSETPSEIIAPQKSFSHSHTPEVKLPDLVGWEGTLKLTSGNSRWAYFNCIVANIGDTTWYSVASLDTHFIYFKIINLDSGKTWEYWKNSYEPVPKCIDLSDCRPIQEYNTLGVKEYDIYTGYYKMFGAGKYLAVQEVNAAGEYAEKNTDNDQYWQGFSYYQDSLGVWKQKIDPSLVTRKNKNKLLHTN